MIKFRSCIILSVMFAGICLGASGQSLQSTSSVEGLQPKGVAVTIPDANLEAALRKAINIPTGDILDTDLAVLTELIARNQANNGRLNGYHQAGDTVLQVLGFGTLTDGAHVAIAGDGTDYVLVSHTASTLTITPGLSAAIPIVSSGTLVTVGGAPAGGIVDLTGLEYCVKLQLLDLTGNSLSNLAPLGALPSLAYLFLTNNQVSDLTPLGGLGTLRGLSLANNKVANLAPLGGLTSLTKLDLWKNKVVDLDPLATLSSLEWLDARENLITDTTGISGLTTLTGLALDNNPIGNTGLAGLSGLVNLTRLAVNFTGVSALTALQGLTNLHILAAGGNVATDYSPLANNAGIADGDYVFLGTALGPANDCASIAALRARGVIVDDLDACQPAPNRNTDRDGDGLGDYDEVPQYCDPSNPDTDGDGMADGWEVQSGLNPVSQLDDNWDADGDETSNLNEFLGQTDPNSPNTPAGTFHVAPNGSDITGTGSRTAPWQTINHAIAAISVPAGTAVTVFLQPGTYNEGLVTLPANYKLWGVGSEDAQGIAPVHSRITIVGRIVAAYPVMMTNITVVPDATPPVPGADALVTITGSAKRFNVLWDGTSVLDWVRFAGSASGAATNWTCVDIQNTTGQTVLRRCTFSRHATAVRVQGSMPNINTCTFANLSGDAVLVAASAAATASGGLGNADDPQTGFNLFRLSSILGKAVNNQSSLTVDVENNEWGTQDIPTIQGHFSGSVGTPDPALPANSTGYRAAEDAYVVVWDGKTLARITNATVTISGYPGQVTLNKLGVYRFTPIPRGTYTFTVTVPGYTPFVKSVFVPLQTDQTALLAPMFKPRKPIEDIAQDLYDNFDTVDTNQDCQLTLQEAQAAEPDLTPADFAELDGDSDGFITQQELDTYLGITGCHCYGQECRTCSTIWAALGAVFAALVAFFFFFWCFSGC